MKKFLLSLLAVLMVFTFVACDNPSGPETWTPITSLEGLNNTSWRLDNENDPFQFTISGDTVVTYNWQTDEKFSEVDAKLFLKMMKENNWEINNTKAKIKAGIALYIRQ